MSRTNHKGAHPAPRPPTELSAATKRFRLSIDHLIPAAVALFSVLAFLPVLQNDFVNWDDFDTLLLNPHYQGFGWKQLRWMFTTFFMGHYQPLSWMTWDLDYLIWGQNPFGYHLTNLFLHSANAVLFYFMTGRLLELASPRSDRAGNLNISLAAALAALLFAVHPLRVESVGWVTERRDVLSAHFLFWTLLCYLRAATGQEAASDRKRWLTIGWMLFLLSLLSKVLGMMLPVLLTILDIYPLKRLSGNPAKWLTAEFRRVLLEKMPFVIPAVVFAVVAIMAQKSVGALESLEGYTLSRRIAQAFYGLAFYLWKTLWPTSLSPLYPIHHRFDPLSRAYLISTFAVLAITAVLFLMRKRWPAGLAAWACYIVLLSPVLGLVQSGPQFVADRYSYLSCLSWAVLAGAGLLVTLRTRTALSNHRKYLLTTGSASLVLLVLGVLTWRYTLIWRSSESLWRHATAMEPQSDLVHLHLANVLRVRKKLPEAVEHYQTALAINPDYAQVYYDYSLALADLGEFDRAVEYMRKYIEKTPPMAAPYVEIGIYLSRQGKTKEASEQYQEALRISPKSALAHTLLANNYEARGEVDAAIHHYREAVRIDSEYFEAHEKLGSLLFDQRQIVEAIPHLEAAVNGNAVSSEAINTLAIALAKTGRIDDAMNYLHAALRANPKDAGTHNNLGIILAGTGQIEDGAKQFREAVRLRRDFAQAHENLSRALMMLGKQEEAIQHHQEAQRLEAAERSTTSRP